MMLTTAIQSRPAIFISYFLGGWRGILSVLSCRCWFQCHQTPSRDTEYTRPLRCISLKLNHLSWFPLFCLENLWIVLVFSPSQRHSRLFSFRFVRLFTSYVFYLSKGINSCSKWIQMSSGARTPPPPPTNNFRRESILGFDRARNDPNDGATRVDGWWWWTLCRGALRRSRRKSQPPPVQAFVTINHRWIDDRLTRQKWENKYETHQRLGLLPPPLLSLSPSV
jgi:hypothetical protein